MIDNEEREKLLKKVESLKSEISELENQIEESGTKRSKAERKEDAFIEKYGALIVGFIIAFIFLILSEILNWIHGHW